MRQKVLYMDWLPEFSCIGGSCPLTCCSASWTILLTDAEIAGYENMDHPYMKDFMALVDKENKCMKTRGKVCAALTDDGWCTLVRECGEEALSTTCTHFPRTMKEYGDTVEGAVEIVCPVVAGYLLDSKAIEFGLVEKQIDASEKKIDYQVYDNLSLVRTYLIELVQEYPAQFLSGKVYIIFSVLNRVKELGGQGNFNKEEVLAMLGQYDHTEVRSAIFEKCEEIAGRYETKGILLQNLLLQILPLLFANIQFSYFDQEGSIQEDLKEWVSDAKRITSCLKEFVLYRDKAFPLMADNFLVYILFLNWITIDLEEFGQVFSARMVELSLIQLFAMSVWRRKGEITKQEYEVIIASVDRVMSHCSGFREQLSDLMVEIGKDNIANVLMILI